MIRRIMDKSILYDYMDACALIKETEADIRRLNNKKKTIVTDKVKGSSAEWPFIEQSFTVEGTPFTFEDEKEIKIEESLLQERKERARSIKLQAEAFLNTASARIQRIVRFKVFYGLSWDEVSAKMGGNSTGEGLRKEFERYMAEK